uniref:RIC3 acetylcholine receptor chaperone n=1 Tax=Catagonus wagneri TaxID=51154 RepID=A0A8C3W541_9CETA
MAYSMLRRVVLASGLVLAVSLLLPKAFLFRGKQEPPRAPEGYPEETYPIYDLSDVVRRRPETILVDRPDPREPSAEEAAERVEVLQEEESDPSGWESPIEPRARGYGASAHGDPQPETCSCRFLSGEDPAVLAENAGLGVDNHGAWDGGTREGLPRGFRNAGPGEGAARAHAGGTRRRRGLQGLE